MRRRHIDPALRRHMDYLRLKALRTARVYEARLKALRRREVRRVLALCKESGSSTDEWAGIIRTNLAEPYLAGIESRLIRDVGLPHARSTVSDMNRAKADGSEYLQTLWAAALEQYARERAGELIVSVSGTLKDDLVRILGERMAAGVSGIEKLTLEVFDGYRELELWQIRRIVQTETMMGLAKAGDAAAQTLDVKFTKTWAVSGLGNSRDTHLAVDGVTVAQDEPFRVGRSYLMYPHDHSLGAEAGEIINCACTCIRSPI